MMETVKVELKPELELEVDGDGEEEVLACVRSTKIEHLLKFETFVMKLSRSWCSSSPA
jgi:hypothetical protein